MSVGINSYSVYTDVVPILVNETECNAGTEKAAEVFKENSIVDDVNKKWQSSAIMPENYNEFEEDRKRFA